jgi:hypothetical protein
MALLMLQARRFPCRHVLSLSRHQAHFGALYYLSNEKVASQMVCTTGRVKAKFQGLLWTVTPLEQRAQGVFESIEVA